MVRRQKGSWSIDRNMAWYKKLAAHWEKLSKYKQPSSKSYANVKAAVEDPITAAKLTFFSFVAGILQPILVKYQSDKPMVPYIYLDLLKLLRKLTQLILKLDIVANCSSVIDLKCIDLDDENVIMKPKDMNMFWYAKYYHWIEKKRCYCKFFYWCYKVYNFYGQKLFDKLPLEYNVVRNSVIYIWFTSPS